MEDIKKLDGTILKNANENLSQYGDDSSAPNQQIAGGMSEKYTGEGTKNSNIEYNKDIKTTDLDPTYKYGRDAQVANSNESGYIARRNDNIASALYNEGKRTKDDVIQFLGNQANWNNSTESDRFNTVESIRKRIGDIQEQEDKNNAQIEEKEIEAETKEEPKGQTVGIDTFLQGSSTELFGKMISGADTAPYDHNSIEWKRAEARLAQYEKINAMSVAQIASSISGGSILSGSQAMRDLQMYNPEKYQQLQDYQKKEDALKQINMIASGNTGGVSLDEQTAEAISNYLTEFVANSGGGDLDRMDLDTALSQNQGLVNYAERMSYYSSKINQLDQTISDLEADARKALGVNAYEYQIQNYINNRSKKLYKQRDNLMNQYNYYKGVYEAQVEQEATAWERDYKERQLALQEAKAQWDQEMDQANLEYKYNQMDNDNLRKIYGDINSYAGSGMKGKGLKNNNPGNIKDTTFGAILGTDGSGFAIFETPEDGFDALVEKIKFNQTNPNSKYYGKTIAEYFKLYAPDSDGNNSTAYANSVAKQLGVSVNTPISQLDATKFAAQIAKHDSGYDYSTYGKFRGNTTNTSKNSKDKTYTNDELFSQLLSGKIKLETNSDAFLKNWNGEESRDEILDRIGEKYFEQKPMMFKSEIKDSVKAINNMIGDEELAEIYTLEHLSKNKNIKNASVVKMVSDYVDEVYESADISEYIAIALYDRVKSEEEIKKILDDSGIEFKKIYGTRKNKIAEAIWENIEERKKEEA